jgi:hypothetical protein
MGKRYEWTLLNRDITNRHMEMWLILLVIKEFHVKNNDEILLHVY